MSEKNQAMRREPDRPSGGEAQTPLDVLRRAGRQAHEQVDTAFSRFDLTDAASYRAFLAAHAAIVPGLEALLARDVRLPHWSPRAGLLLEDLACLGVQVSPSLPLPIGGEGWCLGALYVLEGSRLGGRVLAGRVPEGMPRAYLSAVHEPGGWRGFLDAVGGLLDAGDAAFRESAIAGARDAFGLFEAAARQAP